MHKFERYSIRVYKAWSPIQPPFDGRGFQKL